MKMICPHCGYLLEFNYYDGAEKVLCPKRDNKVYIPPVYGQIVYDNKPRIKETALYVREVIIRQIWKEAFIILFASILTIATVAAIIYLWKFK